MASQAELKRRVKTLAYLNDVSKIRSALAYEFGCDHRLPSGKFIQETIDARKASYVPRIWRVK
jgi:hypothetical protein